MTLLFAASFSSFRLFLPFSLSTGIFIYDLSKAAVSIGISGLFIEVHDDPDNAPPDGPNMLKLSELESFLVKIIKLDNLIKNESL